MKRGKVFVPTLTKEEEAERQKRAEIAEKVKLDADEEEALAGANLTDVMALADILNTNPQVKLDKRQHVLLFPMPRTS